MIYTIKQLSDMSGVSTRTLRFYHEIGLLEPAQIGDNGYRYYEEDQLLLLQQILFFRELGFQLKDIYTIITSNDFDKTKTLLSHKEELTKNILRSQNLIETINRTVLHLNGQIKVDNESMYSGFDKDKQSKYKQYLIKKHGDIAKSFITESEMRTKNWNQDDFIKVRKLHDQLYKEFIILMRKSLKPNSHEVQKLVKRHHDLVKIFYTPTKDVYVRLGETYREHPDFRKYFDAFNPNLAEFLAKAIKYYAKNHHFV